jgi:hypothetical protein
MGALEWDKKVGRKCIYVYNVGSTEGGKEERYEGR